MRIANSTGLQQIILMSTTVMAGPAGPIENRFPTWLSELVEHWMRTCETFWQWEREHTVLREPDEATLAQYREELKWLLRAGRQLQTLVKDPEFRNPTLATELDGCLVHLGYSWTSANHWMSDEELEKFFKTHFPDEHAFIDSILHPK